MKQLFKAKGKTAGAETTPSIGRLLSQSYKPLEARQLETLLLGTRRTRQPHFYFPSTSRSSTEGTAD